MSDNQATNGTATGKRTRKSKKLVAEQAATLLAGTETAATATSGPAAETQGQQLPKGLPASQDKPPKGDPPHFFAAKPGRLRFWLATDKDAYLISGAAEGWHFEKYADGTRYTVTDGIDGLTCSCPGCTEHGPTCASGQGCKHMRMIRALIRLATEG